MECEFMIQSEDEGEIIRDVKQHVTNVHGISMSDEDIRKLMTEAKTA
jgi:predicted small metal-binding protein